MSLIGDFIEGVLKGIPDLIAGEDERTRERIVAGLDACRSALTAIGPNAPTVRAAIERRRAELRADEPTVETPTGKP